MKMEEKMVIKRMIFSLLVFLVAMAAFMAVPAYAQVEIEDLGYQAKQLNPSGGPTPSCTVGGSPTGFDEGAVVMKARIRDVDYPAQDRSNVRVTYIQVSNLGTAEVGAIRLLGFLDKDNRCISTLWDIASAPNGDWGSTLDLSPTPWVIPDDSEQILQVVVWLTNTTNLGSAYQRKTVQLQLILTYEETPSGFTTPQEKESDVAIDQAPEVIWNGGFETAEDEGYNGGILPIGSSGIVQEFTLCDNDAQPGQPVIKRVEVNNQGNADQYDLAGINLYVKSQNTPIASKMVLPVQTPSFKPREPFEITHAGFSYIIADDSCATFQIGVVVSPYAFPEHTIQFHTTIYADEPYNTPIYPGVAREVDDAVSEYIGEQGKRAVVNIRDTLVAAGSSNGTPVKLHWSGIYTDATQSPPRRLHSMSGTLKWDQFVINPIDDPLDKTDDADAFEVLNEHYTLNALINHILGEATFTLLFTGSQTYSAAFDHDILALKVKSAKGAHAGDSTYLDLKDYAVVDTDGKDLGAEGEVVVSPGTIKLVNMGDINGDGRVTIHDATILARAIAKCPDTPPMNYLNESQIRIADVADPKAPSDTVPDCDYLTWADVSGIARLAMTLIATGSADALGASVLTVEDMGVYPNPLANIDGVEFVVKGTGIDKIQVQIFNLAGAKIFERETSGNTLEFHAMDDKRGPLANGIYLYVLTVRGFNGDVVRSQVKKLVVLR